MKFLAPLFFWSFLSFLPLVAIYFLKVRPRRRTATAYFLWNRVFTEKKSHLPLPAAPRSPLPPPHVPRLRLGLPRAHQTRTRQ